MPRIAIVKNLRAYVINLDTPRYPYANGSHGYHLPYYLKHLTLKWAHNRGTMVRGEIGEIEPALHSTHI